MSFCMTTRTSTADGRLGYPPVPRHRDAPNYGQRVSAPYRSGQSRDGLKIKSPDSPAMIRAREVEW